MKIDITFIQNQMKEALDKFSREKAKCISEEMQAKNHQDKAKLHADEMMRYQGEHRRLKEIETTLLLAADDEREQAEKAMKENLDNTDPNKTAEDATEI